ncbi:hypothetical protein BO78DRAFT_21413 [Aspergillus sclerotiicarbonarius CBS 121057]|uniref:Secreted protein n=1 Tax=Aspergillus sclerotiicarbonarius (strain CBS 121057 / IBT 28362) TaxID=1448318 RepID=A0A319EBL7_ASPSB|nr:hypothetical protein BO78DRAFT_21413 [Aspergillus sclerotiicarbonarius CBS 121057]
MASVLCQLGWLGGAQGSWMGLWEPTCVKSAVLGILVPADEIRPDRIDPCVLEASLGAVPGCAGEEGWNVFDPRWLWDHMTIVCLFLKSDPHDPHHLLLPTTTVASR